MIVVDVSENKKVIQALEKKIGKDNYKVEQIGCFDCMDKKFPIKSGYCATELEMIDLSLAGFSPNKEFCRKCDRRKYIRFADFTNESRSFFYERKTVLDFISSRRRRLYEQLNKIDTFVEGRKGLILEGMSAYTPIYDSYWQNIDKNALQKLSPIQQVIKLAGKAEWTKSFIRELKMRDMELVQTWNLDETIDFLIQCDEGYDHTPKLRLLPKRYPEFSIQRNILVLVEGIGKERSGKLMKEYKTLYNLIIQLKDMNGEKRKKHQIYNKLYEAFFNEG